MSLSVDIYPVKEFFFFFFLTYLYTHTPTTFQKDMRLRGNKFTSRSPAHQTRADLYIFSILFLKLFLSIFLFFIFSFCFSITFLLFFIFSLSPSYLIITFDDSSIDRTTEYTFKTSLCTRMFFFFSSLTLTRPFQWSSRYDLITQ